MSWSLRACHRSGDRGCCIMLRTNIGWAYSLADYCCRARAVVRGMWLCKKPNICSRNTFEPVMSGTSGQKARCHSTTGLPKTRDESELRAACCDSIRSRALDPLARVPATIAPRRYSSLTTGMYTSSPLSVDSKKGGTFLIACLLCTMLKFLSCTSLISFSGCFIPWKQCVHCFI
ncbi:hypothetical protein GOBAR_AA00696 [Gossypium barbadense]|uniref:Uncharacterized protein n=1 Tax=Gossypium barbadense TaxID=3634 RepID=A0A2P5YW98_GOSBA|nr:hypothetical protein GOBAR_AA00696 [Gossypium barbadense]